MLVVVDVGVGGCGVWYGAQGATHQWPGTPAILSQEQGYLIIYYKIYYDSKKYVGVSGSRGTAVGKTAGLGDPACAPVDAYL